jgi:hypothetical protein
LITLPMSSTQTYERIATRPVSVSTSVAHRCVPCGKEKFSGSKVASESRFGSTPSGRSCAANTASAMSWMDTDFACAPAPLTRNAPAANSTSSSPASSMCAATFAALAFTLSAACTTAMAPTVSDREP